MKQVEYVGKGSIEKLEDILKAETPKKIFLLVGKNSFEACGISRFLTRYLKDVQTKFFNDFSVIPTVEDLEKGIVSYQSFNPDFLIAIGGGHVLDSAKAVNFRTGQKTLLAIPTTAGSGAEATPFAVLYENGKKTSLEDPRLLPAYTIVDPALSYSTPRNVALASGLDALTQSIESYWARGATKESRQYAQDALMLIWPNITNAILNRDERAIDALSIGAHLAGKAIAISRTTACHALSYGLTAHFGVAHGLAVALLLPRVMLFNKITLPSGPSVEEVEELLRVLQVPTMQHFGVQTKDFPGLAAEVNVERLVNNPRSMTKNDMIDIYSHVFQGGL